MVMFPDYFGWGKKITCTRSFISTILSHPSLPFFFLEFLLILLLLLLEKRGVCGLQRDSLADFSLSSADQCLGYTETSTAVMTIGGDLFVCLFDEVCTAIDLGPIPLRVVLR